MMEGNCSTYYHLWWCMASLDQVWSILPPLKLLPLNCSRRGGATPMQAKWIKLDLWRPGIVDVVMYSQTHCNSWVWAMLAHWRVAMNIKLGDDPSQAHLGECYLCIVVCHYRVYCHLGIPGSYHSCWQFFSQSACFKMRKLVGMSACFDIEVQR